jgi:hypothetical protein
MLLWSHSCVSGACASLLNLVRADGCCCSLWLQPATPPVYLLKSLGMHGLSMQHVLTLGCGRGLALVLMLFEGHAAGLRTRCMQGCALHLHMVMAQTLRVCSRAHSSLELQAMPVLWHMKGQQRLHSVAGSSARCLRS